MPQKHCTPALLFQAKVILCISSGALLHAHDSLLLPELLDDMPTAFGPAADDFKAFLARFGLHVSFSKFDNVTAAQQKAAKAHFGFENPIQALLEQKFLKKEVEKTIDGSSEDIYTLGDAQCGDACECPEEDMQANVNDIMQI